MGFLVDSKAAKLYDLQTVYSLEDAYLLAEISNVNAYNRANSNKDK